MSIWTSIDDTVDVRCVTDWVQYANFTDIAKGYVDVATSDLSVLRLSVFDMRANVDMTVLLEPDDARRIVWKDRLGPRDMPEACRNGALTDAGVEVGYEYDRTSVRVSDRKGVR